MSQIIVNILILLLAISPSFALGDGNRNILLIVSMCVTPLFILKHPFVIKKIDVPLIILMFCMLIFPLILHPEGFRWTTIFYSWMFCINYMAFSRVLFFSNYTFLDFINVLKYIIYAYCIVLLIQQFCVLTGLPIFNVSNYSLREPWKLNSLMSEPSHTARIVSLLMYLIILCKKHVAPDVTFKESWKKDKYLWLSFFWMILTMSSATGLIFATIVFTHFFNIKKIFKTIIPISLLLFIFFLYSDNKSANRVKDTVKATLTLDEKTIINTDHSASFRIVPTIQGAKFVGLTTISDWFGYGIDADSRLISPLPSVKEGSGGAFYMWINYGFCVAVIFWIFSFVIIYEKNHKATLLIWFLFIFICGGINSQIIWLTLTLMLTYKYLLFQCQSKIDS